MEQATFLTAAKSAFKNLQEEQGTNNIGNKEVMHWQYLKVCPSTKWMC